MIGLKCVRCVVENQPPTPAEEAVYMFAGTSLCERHIRPALQEYAGMMPGST